MADSVADQLFADVARIRLKLNEKEPAEPGSAKSDSTYLGSGRLIGHNLVLTARHVLESEQGTALPDRGWEVRLVGDQTEPGRWSGKPLPARVAWRGGAEVDLALLELVECECHPKLVRIRFGRYEAVENVADCWVAGFPWAARQNPIRARPYGFPAALRTAEPGGPFRLTVTTADAASEAKDWRGISGGTVLARRNGDVWLLGAVQHVPKLFGTGALEVARVDAAWKDKVFIGLVERSRSPEKPTLEKLPATGSPQPVLTSNVLATNQANRLTYRSRKITFVGRLAERAVLGRFLASDAAVSWLVLVGPGGSGKSRLAQEFCLDVDATWRAGFLAPGQKIDWHHWLPHSNTLMVIDYAAERVPEIRAIFDALHARTDLHTRVRVLLVERAADGPWMQELIGSRSSGYAIDQMRSTDSPLLLGPMNSEEHWATITSVLRAAGHPFFPSKSAVLNRLREIDPEGRPLFAAFVADALLSSRSLRRWDRQLLLRDVLSRWREGWARNGVTKDYENLLAVATTIGGDTEDIMETQEAPLKFPELGDFTPETYSVMTGCDPTSNNIPALKPDIFGEFFVLEHARGRNERLTRMQAADLMLAGWRIRGGTERRLVSGVTFFVPSSLIHFLKRLVEDFPDHPATRYFFCKPPIASQDLTFWPTVVAVAIRQYAEQGDIEAARFLFDEVSALGTEELRAIGIGGFVEAAIYFLSAAAAGGHPEEAYKILDDLGPVISEARRAFFEAAPDAIALVLQRGQRKLAERLLSEAERIVVADPDPEWQNLWLHYARALSAATVSADDLAWQEQRFDQLLEFCRQHLADYLLNAPLASAALVLCRRYCQPPERLEEAVAKNNLIRGLERDRALQTVWRYKEVLSLEREVFEDDLRDIRASLAQADAELIAPFTRAKRFRDTDVLLEEVKSLWLRHHRHDIEFAGFWANAIVMHADARARQGATQEVARAIDGLQQLAHEFDGNPQFILRGSMLVRAVSIRAANDKDSETALELLQLLEKLAREAEAPPDTVADYAQATMAICHNLQQTQRVEESLGIVCRAEWAIRSEAYQERLRQRGATEAEMEKIQGWIEAMLASRTTPPPADGSDGQVGETPAGLGQNQDVA